jgi:flavin reductase (DIM6/NTAB) family NADH-FMN oxidoreductase RutF
MAIAADTAGFRAAMSHFPTGVAVVTAVGPDGPAGLTSNAVCSLSLDPLLAIVCLDRESRTLAAIRDSGRLAVNVLAADQEDLALAFATKAPAHEKFAGVDHRVEDGLPVIHGAVAWLTGAVRELLPGGDHEIAVMEVERAEAPGGEPLLWYRSAYRGLADR